MLARLHCLLFLAALLVSACASPREASSRRVAEDGLTAEYYRAQYPQIPWKEIGRSVEDRPIHRVDFGTGDDVTLIIFCFHGNERCTPRMGFELTALLHEQPHLVQPGRRAIVVPALNPDGFAADSRWNANGVDLNRNYPTSNWGQQPENARRQVRFGDAPASEPETKIVLELLEELDPDKIISIHQPLECNNPDGEAGIPLAEIFGKYNGYPFKMDIGFPTPGSFGTYAGKELGIPMVTLELPRGEPNEPIYDEMWDGNRQAFIDIINYEVGTPVDATSAGQ